MCTIMLKTLFWTFIIFLMASIFPVAGAMAQVVPLVEEDAEGPSVDIASISKDHRFLKNYCELVGIKTLQGQCPKHFTQKEIYFGSVPAHATHFYNTVALTITTTDILGSTYAPVLCSGSLIAKSFVLTARHCVEANETQRRNITHVVFGTHANKSEDSKQKKIKVVGCVDWLNGKVSSCQKTKNTSLNSRDIILVKLKKPSSSIPAKLAKQMWVDEASNLTVVGFGRTEPTLKNPLGTIGQKLFAIVPIVSPRCDGLISGITDADRYGCKTGLEIVAGTAGHNTISNADTCIGDSGGPIYLTKNLENQPSVWPDDYFLAGVTSRAITKQGFPLKRPYCGDGGVYVRIDDEVISWLTKTIEVAGETLMIGIRD